jgi:hypothetical protein
MTAATAISVASKPYSIPVTPSLSLISRVIGLVRGFSVAGKLQKKDAAFRILVSFSGLVETAPQILSNP